MSETPTPGATIHALPVRELTKQEAATLEVHRFAHDEVLPLIGDDGRGLYNAALHSLLKDMMRRHGIEIPPDPNEMPLSADCAILSTL